MIRVHEAKRFPGGIIVSLSIPWGFAKGDDDLGGYHLIWPRDLVEAAGGLLAAGAQIDARRPVTQQDHWEEDPGYSPFTLAVEIAALLVAADLADLNGEPAIAAYLRETADAWNGGIERWTYETDTGLTRQVGVEGYCVRIAPPEVAEAASPAAGFVPIRNRRPVDASPPWLYCPGHIEAGSGAKSSAQSLPQRGFNIEG